MGVRRLAVANGPNIFQMLLVLISSHLHIVCSFATVVDKRFRFITSQSIDRPTNQLIVLIVTKKKDVVVFSVLLSSYYQPASPAPVLDTGYCYKCRT